MIGQEVEDHTQNESTVRSESRVGKIFFILIDRNKVGKKESFY